jgi:isopentenyl diphosphate isomerase/L-lactate dehydrogenase-like FMN-dependent dehydrogenase
MIRRELSTQIRIAMFASGAADIPALKQTPLYPVE